MAQESDIPSRIIKENSDVFVEYLLSGFNGVIDKSYFPTALKHVNITLVFKTGEWFSKDNYWPKSIIPNVSNIYSLKHIHVAWVSQHGLNNP